MSRPLQILLTITAALACAMFASSCDLMEGINQTSPNYRRPVPFSTHWFERIQARHNLRQIERDWGVNKPRNPFIHQP